jgi:kanamycin kinase
VTFEPPEALRVAHRDWQWSVAWEWPGDATTWRLEQRLGGARFLKVGRTNRWPNGLDECARMRWARPFLPVPDVLDCGSDGTVDWLLTFGLEGTDATQHPLRAQPRELVTALGRALAAFHDAAPVERCPFDFTAEAAIAHVRHRAERGLIDARRHLHPEHRHLGVDAAIAQLEALAPAEEDLVVCHGDYCLPNVMLDDDGRVTGYLDVGELGVADRWWDIAVGSWSVSWNLGPGLEELFSSSYGTAPDARRIAFYRLLYDLAS